MLSELCVVKRLIELEYEVFKPLRPDSKIDLATYDPRTGRWATLQIKSATAQKRKGYTRVHTRVHLYAHDTFDFLVAVDSAGSVRYCRWSSVYPRKTVNFMKDLKPL